MENLHPQSVKTGSNEKDPFYSNQFWQTVDEAFQILIAVFFGIALGFLKSYRTPF